jgi:heme-degrading monooxygenase HmoA
MSQPALIVLVRLRSSLPRDEVVRVMRERMPEFAAIEGLQQKYYLEDPATREYAGLYLWRSPEDLAQFSESALRATIAQAYGVEGEPRIEVYEVLTPLRDS